MTEREVNLKAKGPGVNLMVDPVFMDAAPILKTAWTMYGAECVVTSGRDGHHSRQSAHDRGRALDLRVNNLTSLGPTGLARFALNLSKALVENLGPYWYCVLEYNPPHIHLEYAGPNERPNIVAWKSGQHFYEKLPKPNPQETKP